MKNLKVVTLSLLLAGLFLTSCKKDIVATGTAASIPGHVTSVTGIDLQRLLKKADFESIRDMEFFKEMVGKATKQSPVVAAAMKDPATSGIDLTGKIYMATDVDKEDPETITTHVFVPLANAADFEKLVTAAGVEFETQNGLNVFATNNNKDAVMIWNDELMTLSFSNKGEIDVAAKAKSLFEMDSEQSVATNRSFAKANDADHDLVTWISSETLADNPNARVALQFLDVDRAALKDNFIHAYGDFENGKIVGHSDFLLNKDLKSGVLDRLFQDRSDTDFSKVLPTNDLVFAMTGSLNFRGMDQFLSERPQSKEYADFVLNDFAGFDRKEIIETLSGDMMLAGYAQTDTAENNFIAALAVKNNKKAQAMLDKAVADKKLKEVEPGIYNVLAIGGKDFSIRINKGMGKFLYFENMLVYSPNEALLQQIKRGDLSLGGPKIGNALQHFDGQAMAAWFDFQSIEKEIGNLPQAFFKDMRFNANSKGADFILETTDPNKNSLKAMFELMEQKYLRENREAM